MKKTLVTEALRDLEVGGRVEAKLRAAPGC